MDRKLILLILVLYLQGTPRASAQFTTIIDIPPAILDQHNNIMSGTQVNVFSGLVEATISALEGSEVNLFGGTVTGRIRSFDGSILNIEGGVLEDVAYAQDGGLVNISGGTVDDIVIAAGGTANISGGSIGAFFPTFTSAGFDARSGSIANVSGGTFGENFDADSGSAVTLCGREFRLDGSIISGLDVVGNMVPFDIPTGSVLTGTFEDGTPFALSSLNSASIANGVLTLKAAVLPEASSLPILASLDPVPPGVREGENLIVDAGGIVGDHFRAGWGSTVRVEAGGVVGAGFSALSGSVVHFLGGDIGNFVDALHGSRVHIAGGQVGSIEAFGGSQISILGGATDFIEASGDSQVDISNGSVSGFRALDDSVVNISGGMFDEDITATGVSEVNISGGTFVEDLTARGVSELNISGGTFNKVFTAFEGSEVYLFGTEFVLDDLDITTSLTPNVPFVIPDRDITLSGVFADGTPFSFDLNSIPMIDQDFFGSGVSLTVTLVPEPTTSALALAATLFYFGRRRGR